VRELKNLVLRAAVLHRGASIDASDMGLPDPGEAAAPAPKAETGAQPGLVVPDGATLAEAERLIVMAALERCAWNRTAAAQALGIAPKTLYNKLKAWGAGEP
jgi:DNA-binding NtrC family response regulator